MLVAKSVLVAKSRLLVAKSVTVAGVSAENYARNYTIVNAEASGTESYRPGIVPCVDFCRLHCETSRWIRSRVKLKLESARPRGRGHLEFKFTSSQESRANNNRQARSFLSVSTKQQSRLEYPQSLMSIALVRDREGPDRVPQKRRRSGWIGESGDYRDGPSVRSRK